MLMCNYMCTISISYLTILIAEEKKKFMNILSYVRYYYCTLFYWSCGVSAPWDTISNKLPIINQSVINLLSINHGFTLSSNKV